MPWTHFLSERDAKEIVELKNQIEQHIKTEKKLQAQRDKMAEEMKKIEEEIELLKNVIEKQKERLQVGPILIYLTRIRQAKQTSLSKRKRKLSKDKKDTWKLSFKTSRSSWKKRI